MSVKMFKIIVNFAVFLALAVVMLGAYTRLTNAGLGCPDWPGCYGKMIIPNQNESLQLAQSSYPDVPIEKTKAWTEMIHRYFAGTLALIIFYIGVVSLLKRFKENAKVSWRLPAFLMLLVILQALLGMWTVTLKLLPVVVMAHLLGGMLIFACLNRYRMQISTTPVLEMPRWRKWIGIGFILVFCQIALGGWVSANYAGISCIGFPTCNGVWWPDMPFSRGFNLFSPVGANYQGGLLANDARASIQMIHRLGAVITATYILILSICFLMSTHAKPLRFTAIAALLIVFIQFSLGMANVIYLLPLSVAVAHNGCAALLLATLFSMLHLVKKRSLANAG